LIHFDESPTLLQGKIDEAQAALEEHKTTYSDPLPGVFPEDDKTKSISTPSTRTEE